MPELIRQPMRCLNCGRMFSGVDDDGCPCHDPDNFHTAPTPPVLATVPVFRPIIGLVETIEVSTDTDPSVLGVIARVDDDDWRIISVRYGASEPAPRAYPSKWAAALALTDRKELSCTE